MEEEKAQLGPSRLDVVMLRGFGFKVEQWEKVVFKVAVT